MRENNLGGVSWAENMMNFSETAALLSRLDGLAKDLTEMSHPGLEQQPVGVLLKLADTIRAIGQGGEQLHSQIEAFLNGALVDEAQKPLLKDSQDQLQRLIAQCRGDGQPSHSLKKVKSDFNQWRMGLLKIMKQVEEVETRQTVQAECEQLRQEIEGLQNQAISAELDNQRKLELLKRLIEIEKSLAGVEQSLQGRMSSGAMERERLEVIRKDIGEVRSTITL